MRACFTHSALAKGTVLLALNLMLPGLLEGSEDCQEKLRGRHRNKAHSFFSQLFLFSGRNDAKMNFIIAAAKAVEAGGPLPALNSRRGQEFMQFASNLRNPQRGPRSFHSKEGPSIRLPLRDLAHILAVASREGYLCPARGGSGGVFLRAPAIRAALRSGSLQSEVAALDKKQAAGRDAPQVASMDESPVPGRGHGPEAAAIGLPGPVRKASANARQRRSSDFFAARVEPEANEREGGETPHVPTSDELLNPFL